MNFFRFAGDLLHLFSFIVLALKIKAQHSVVGISLKTQILFFIVFVTRYLDLYENIIHMTWFSWYLATMKIIFIGATAWIIYLIFRRYPKQYNKDEDSLPLYFLIPPCFILALFVNEEFTPREVLWAFSIYLEAIAILPQLVLLQKTGNVENLTSHYIACLGGYRALYLLNWIYRLVLEENYRHWIVWISGFIQTILYIDFFYYYFISQIKGTKLQLPTNV